MKKTAFVWILVLVATGFAQDAPAPAGPPSFEAVVCQGWDSAAQPEGITDSFFADNASVRVVYWTEEKPEAGHRLTPVVVTAGGETVLVGNAITTDGMSNRWGSGFLLAGQAWARAGGDFRFRIHWDTIDRPVVEMPFTIRTGKRFALLVGIADYPPEGPGGSDLPAPDQDAQRMMDLLVGSFGFPADRIVLVTNLEATSHRIAAELTALAEKAGPDDAVLFYYEGHGAQIPDLDGDEEDGWDEALATADPTPDVVTTKEQLDYFLSDDRLGELLRAFKTKNVTVIFDSCHSGTAVREGEEEPQGEAFYSPMRTRPGFGRKLVQMAEDAPRKPGQAADEGLDIDQRYVFVSASRSWETSMGGPAGGLFSMNLREFLRTANGESWDQIVHRLRPVVQAMNPGQAPQVEGATRRFPFSLAEAPADAPFVRATVAIVGAMDPETRGILTEGEAGKHVALVSGLASLINEQAGVAYDVYSAGDETLSGPSKGRVLLTGKMEQIDRMGLSPLYWAGADILSGTVNEGDRLVPRSVKVPGARPAVGIFIGNVADDVLDRLKGAAQAVLGFLTKDGSVLLKQGKPGDMDYVVLPRIQNGKLVALVFTPALQFVGSVSGTDATIGQEVRDLVLARHRDFSRLNRLANPSAPFDLKVVLDGDRCRGTVGVPARIFAFAAAEGEPVRLVAQSEGMVEPGKEFVFEVPIDKGSKKRTAVKVFAVTKPIDLAAIERASDATRGDALFAALRSAFPSPDGGLDRLGTDGWAEELVWVGIP